MRKEKKRIFSIIIYNLVAILFFYSIFTSLFPEKAKEMIGYQPYIVLTNSMEPEIPTYSLVLVKKFKKDEAIDLHPQQIITFHAERFGQNVIITHHFNKVEVTDDGTIIYRTNAAGKDNLDSYQTTREDLIGTYLFHIPYIGKIILFLKSKFGFILYGEFIIIFLINSLIRARWEEKENKNIT